MASKARVGGVLVSCGLRQFFMVTDDPDLATREARKYIPRGALTRTLYTPIMASIMVYRWKLTDAQPSRFRDYTAAVKEARARGGKRGGR